MEGLNFYRIADGRVWDIGSAKFTEDFSEEGLVDLRSDGRPAGSDYLRQTLEFYGFTVGDELLTDEDRAKAAREKRDRLLAETDFLLMPDYPISEEALEALKVYRQALRDVPEQVGFPNTIEWPETPGEIE